MVVARIQNLRQLQFGLLKLLNGFVFGLYLTGCSCQSIECDFMRGSLDTAEARLSSYPLDQQYGIFRYTNTEVHPPMLWLANPIARRGAEAIPFLVQRLKTAEDDTEFRDLLLILHRMVLFDTYDVRSNRQLIALLSERMASVQDWNDVIVMMFSEIQAK